MKPILLILGFLFFLQTGYSQKTDREQDRLKLDFKLYELRTCVQEVEYLTIIWVFVDKVPDTYYKRKLTDILENQLPKLLSDLKSVYKDNRIADLPEIEAHLDTLTFHVRNIMSNLSSYESYDDPFIVFEIIGMAVMGGEIDWQAHQIISRIDKHINYRFTPALAYPLKVSNNEKLEQERKEREKQEELKECEIFMRKSDSCLVCVPIENDPEWVADIDEITELLVYKKDTLIEDRETSYIMHYTKGGVLSIDYGYGDYPEGMSSISARYEYKDGTLKSYHMESVVTNYWVEPDSCCPTKSLTADYYFEDGIFVSGSRTFEDSEDEEANSYMELEEGDEIEMRFIMKHAEKLQHAIILK